MTLILLIVLLIMLLIALLITVKIRERSKGIKIINSNHILQILYSIVFHFITFFTFRICSVDSKFIDYQGGIVPISIYKANDFYYLLGIVVFCLLYTVFWKFFLKEAFIKQFNNHKLSFIISIFLLIMFYITEIFVYALSCSFMTELEHNKLIYLLGFLYPIIFSIISFILSIKSQGEKQ